jgi:hypothetical protein
MGTFAEDDAKAKDVLLGEGLSYLKNATAAPGDESGALGRLQRLASDKNRKLIDIAQRILTAEEAYGGTDPD